MKHFTDACRIEKIRSNINIKYYLWSLDDEPNKNNGSLYTPPPHNSDPTPRHDDSYAPPSHNSEPTPKYNDNSYTCASYINEYIPLDEEKYFRLINIVKGFKEMNIDNIQKLGKLISPKTSSKIRRTKVFLASQGKIDRKVIFPDEKEVGFRTENFCKYVNDNPDKLDRIELASVFAYGFCMAHPFIDGNGRTSRLLANYFLKDNEVFNPLSTDKADYRAACFRINLTGDFNPMYEYFHKRLTQH